MRQYPPMEEVLPHRAPMILLDAIEDDSTSSLTCTVDLRDASPFVENGRVAAVVATEYMAQCVAAYAGLKAVREGKPVRIGYIIGARSIELQVDEFSVGSRLVVRADHVWGDDILGSFECSVQRDGSRVASALMTVYQGEIEDEPQGEDPDEPPGREGQS